MKRWRDLGWGEEKLRLKNKIKKKTRKEKKRKKNGGMGKGKKENKGRDEERAPEKKRIENRRKRIGVYLSGDSSISRKSLFMGTREPRRTTAQKRRNELSTCLMQGIHNNKYCIWLAPLPCLNNNTSISHRLFLIQIKLSDYFSSWYSCHLLNRNS